MNKFLIWKLLNGNEIEYCLKQESKRLNITFIDKLQQTTFCISNGRESTKYQGLQPAQTAYWFNRKLPHILPLLIQFAVRVNSPTVNFSPFVPCTPGPKVNRLELQR